MILSNMHAFVGPFKLMAAQMCILGGCFGLKQQKLSIDNDIIIVIFMDLEGQNFVVLI